jgi:hypothetical protein
MNDVYYFDCNFPNAKLHPYDDYKNMSTLNTYCGILSTCHSYKKFIIVEFFVQVVKPGRHFCHWRLIFESDEYFPYPIRHLNFQKIVEKCL